MLHAWNLPSCMDSTQYIFAEWMHTCSYAEGPSHIFSDQGPLHGCATCAIVQGPMLRKVQAWFKSCCHLESQHIVWARGPIFFSFCIESHKLGSWSCLQSIFIFFPLETPLDIKLTLLKRHLWCLPGCELLTACWQLWSDPLSPCDKCHVLLTVQESSSLL